MQGYKCYTNQTNIQFMQKTVPFFNTTNFINFFITVFIIAIENFKSCKYIYIQSPFFPLFFIKTFCLNKLKTLFLHETNL